MISITTPVRCLAAAAAIVALAGALLVPGHAKAASLSLSPLGAVTNAESGTIWFFLDSTPVEQPHVEGWAVDPNAGAGAIAVRADVTWYRNMCWTTFCSSRVVGQTSFSQMANLPEATNAMGWGPNHGFWFGLPSFFFGADREQVCVTAINVGPGSDTSLGCYDVKGFHIT